MIDCIHVVQVHYYYVIVNLYSFAENRIERNNKFETRKRHIRDLFQGNPITVLSETVAFSHYFILNSVKKINLLAENQVIDLILTLLLQMQLLIFGHL